MGGVQFHVRRAQDYTWHALPATGLAVANYYPIGCSGPAPIEVRYEHFQAVVAACTRSPTPLLIPDDQLVDAVEQAILGGARLVQYRDKAPTRSGAWPRSEL